MPWSNKKRPLWSGELWPVWSVLAVCGTPWTTPCFIYVSMLCLCCSALASIFTFEVHENDIIAASRSVA